ncbi:SDR family NAD(P)-dependent oxidoreductase [Rhodococcus sp. MSC1_016]|jgi:NAD(P)-dependent dehydrogenase (short-subunit alcohol dehydrogenase family)|uniref:SDR family NAD(P)-dependent oxidoreductase n=1 Tax=Rhodococcus sp. MSC1_016 TaxID=2909266 RepID=UPI002030E524|nr:SDR family oxidoreductase [Rhodococcus sp. MSC1_016]
MNRLAGKVAIVTGTSPNIGGTLAKGLAKEGAAVVCTDIDPEVAKQCAASIQAEGGLAVAHAGDVTDQAHVHEVVQQTVANWGRIDILVNNAVQFNVKGLLAMSIDEFRRQTDIILSGSFLFTRAVAETMIEKGEGGSIINVLSTAAWQGQPGNVGYCTGKSGLINFTRSVAMELAEFGIRVNGFTPTATMPTDPDLLRNLAEPAAPSQYQMDFFAEMPLKRLPSPEDYVPAVVFLASDDSMMMTGTNITVDGGATAKYWPWTPHGKS